MGSCRVGPPPAWHPHPAFHAWRPTSAAPPHRPRSCLMSRGRALNPRQRAIRYDRDGRDGVGVFTRHRTSCLTNSAARFGSTHHNEGHVFRAFSRRRRPSPHREPRAVLHQVTPKPAHTEGPTRHATRRRRRPPHRRLPLRFRPQRRPGRCGPQPAQTPPSAHHRGPDVAAFRLLPRHGGRGRPLRHLRQRDRQGTAQAPPAVLEGAGADRVPVGVRGRPLARAAP